MAESMYAIRYKRDTVRAKKFQCDVGTELNGFDPAFFHAS